eukprot:SAG31_NODE_34022_length_337_cov_1.071429_2_plen_45_part_01
MDTEPNQEPVLVHKQRCENAEEASSRLPSLRPLTVTLEPLAELFS